VKNFKQYNIQEEQIRKGSMYAIAQMTDAEWEQHEGSKTAPHLRSKALSMFPDAQKERQAQEAKESEERKAKSRETRRKAQEAQATKQTEEEKKREQEELKKRTEEARKKYKRERQLKRIMRRGREPGWSIEEILSGMNYDDDYD
jgi:hypothetical protein